MLLYLKVMNEVISMCCRSFITWCRFSLFTCRLHSVLCRMLLMILFIAAVHYALINMFTAHKLESLFSVNSVRSPSYGRRGNPREIQFPNQLNPGVINSAKKNLMLAAYNASHKHSIVQNTVKSKAIKVVELNTTLQTLAVSESGRTLCPPLPPNLYGPIKVLKGSPPFEKLEKKFSMLSLGGRYSPTECQARNKVAIIVPYRDRAEHLRTFLLNLHPMLQRQQLDYGIFVIEQAGNEPFNRAKLMNIGFVEALKQYSYDCFIFHDVDLLPENDRNLYSCSEQPKHMSVAVDTQKYKLPYASIFGGVSAMTKTQFQKVNGFSNMFWGWGGEDDDMSNRISYHGYHIARYPANVARYKMLAHHKEKANPKRYKYLYTGPRRFKTDGLSSLHYKIKELNLRKLFTRIIVELSI